MSTPSINASVPELHLSDYKILDKVLGIGAFGSVHLAKSLKTDSFYAFKIINLSQLQGPQERELIRKEVNLHSKSKHPHIIKLHGVIKENETLYYVLDYAENGNLYKFFKKKPKIAEIQIFRYFYQTLQALKYLHDNDIMHRDIKVYKEFFDKIA